MNLEHEVPEWDFKQLCNNTKKAWNDKLSKFHIKGNNKDDAPIFYTALYHCYLFPREFSEYGKYYSAFDDKIHDGFSYNDYSLWDTFRAFHPLMTLIEPELTGDWITALLQMYKEGGWLPMWLQSQLYQYYDRYSCRCRDSRCLHERDSQLRYRSGL
ncbi:glycoside hydrolase family 92 protein [Bacteroides salyersiae]|nr:glycoside hydrolase family 92 protein [Bacteroides salyersiae]